MSYIVALEPYSSSHDHANGLKQIYFRSPYQGSEYITYIEYVV